MIEKTVLNCGLVVISEFLPGFSSVALSYSVRGGSRAENTENNGIHHCIEHMLFKGSSKYDLKQIADISDRLGGRLNAFTSKEITQYYIKSIAEKLPDSFDILTDIIINSTFPMDEFLKERNVLVQEIKEAEDNPETNAFEILYEEIYKNNGLGFPIGGKEDRVASFDRNTIYDFYKNCYSPDNLLLAGVGNIRHEHLVQLANDAFKDFPPRTPTEFNFPIPSYQADIFAQKNKSLNQVYAIIGFEAPSSISPQRHRFSLMNDILGGGMSSRLFQQIREQKALAYTVNSFADTYLDCGIHLIYSIVDKKKINEFLETVETEILRLKEKGVTQDELDRSRDHMTASVVLSLEGPTSRMRFHANNELNLKREMTVAEILEDIKTVTVEDINDLCRDYLDMSRASVFFYGDLKRRQARKIAFGSDGRRR